MEGVLTENYLRNDLSTSLQTCDLWLYSILLYATICKIMELMSWLHFFRYTWHTFIIIQIKMFPCACHLK